MRIVAFDPYITEERARHMGVELFDIDTLLAQADFITIHLPKTKETTNLLNAESLKKCKKGVRIVNVARGGIVNEADLVEAIKSGHVQGAALDVFEKEPLSPESPLLELPSVVVVPHLGASTVEAQDKAGIAIAEQVQLALAGDFVPFAVNVAAGAVSNSVRPFMGLAELLGRFVGGLSEGRASDLEVIYQGELAGSGTKILTLCALKGFLQSTGHESASFVNAPQLAEEIKLSFSEKSNVESGEYVSLITVRAGDHAVSGTLMSIGTRVETRLVNVDGHSVEINPGPTMLVVRNDDRPGMIGHVGVALGEANISITAMAVGPDPRNGTALMVLSTGAETPVETLERLRATNGIKDIHAISLR
jgi:D-3-phosphoglycerate dehydrogenase